MSYKYNLAPKGLAEQSAGFKKQYPHLVSLPAEDYLMQAKYDGCLAIVNGDGGAPDVMSRTGEEVLSMPHIAEACAKAFPDLVLFGEAWISGVPFKDLSGKYRRQYPQPDLGFIVFDAVPWQDYSRGKCDIPYSERLAGLSRAAWAAYHPGIFVAQTTALHAPEAFAAALVDLGGYDGAIIRRKDAGWRPGASKEGEAIKVKPNRSLDLEATGWFPGKGKHLGRAGGITVIYKGVATDVGTGFSDAEREAIALAGTRCRIAEIEFMGFTEAGKLREPRFKGWRYDKTEPDQ